MLDRRAIVLLIICLLTPQLQAQKPISSQDAWDLGWPLMAGPYGNFRVAQTGTIVSYDL